MSLESNKEHQHTCIQKLNLNRGLMFLTFKENKTNIENLRGMLCNS